MMLNWVANRSAAIPANMPWMANTIIRCARVMMPDSRAASALPPTAYMARPVAL